MEERRAAIETQKKNLADKNRLATQNETFRRTRIDTTTHLRVYTWVTKKKSELNVNSKLSIVRDKAYVSTRHLALTRI